MWLSLWACLGAADSARARTEWDFERILSQVQVRYGQLASADQRLHAWNHLLTEAKGLPEREQLTAINRFFNHQLAFRTDQQIWGVEDYWASPVEALLKGAGDCEDYALAKYFSLRHLGVPAEKLRITYVKALTRNQAHMVLTYYDSAIPWVLDNLVDSIQPAVERSDLLPVYAFNAEGVYLPSTNGAAPGEKLRSDSKQLSRWQAVLRKMSAEGFFIDQG